MSTSLGRTESSQDKILNDSPSQKVAGMLRKIDELNAAIKGLAAKIDSDSGDTGGDTDYADLWTDDLSNLDLTM